MPDNAAAPAPDPASDNLLIVLRLARSWQTIAHMIGLWQLG
jgi:hypothetical protein